jgi:hypothetical protein
VGCTNIEGAVDMSDSRFLDSLAPSLPISNRECWRRRRRRRNASNIKSSTATAAPIAMPTISPVLRCELELPCPPPEPDWPPLELEGPLIYTVVMLPPGRVEIDAALEDPGAGVDEPPEFEVGLFVPEPAVDKEEALGLWPA